MNIEKVAIFFIHILAVIPARFSTVHTSRLIISNQTLCPLGTVHCSTFKTIFYEFRGLFLKWIGAPLFSL